LLTLQFVEELDTATTAMGLLLLDEELSRAITVTMRSSPEKNDITDLELELYNQF
jgi:hypothetical protein